MRRIRYFALGLLLALAGGALAVTSGGFPSRPVFSQTTVTCNGAAGCAPAAGTGTRQHICNTGATSGQRCYSLNVDTNGALGVVLEADNLTGLSTGLLFNRSGSTSGALTYAGFAIPRVSYAHIVLAGSSCSVAGGASGITGCTNTGAGQYQLTLTAFPSTPLCVANPQPPYIQLLAFGVSTTQANLDTYTIGSTTPANTTGDATVICMQ